MLIVGLIKRQGSEDYLLEYIEHFTPLPRHWIKPDQSRTIHQAFPAEFAEFVASRLRRIDRSTMVYTDPDVSLEFSGLRLESLRIVSTLSPDQDQILVIRFSKVQGSVAVLLNDVKSSITQEKQDIAVEALESVVSRAYNVAFLAQQLKSLDEQSGFADCVRSIEQKKDELLFRLRLLNRAASQQENDHPSASLDPQRHIVSNL